MGNCHCNSALLHLDAVLVLLFWSVLLPESKMISLSTSGIKVVSFARSRFVSYCERMAWSCVCRRQEFSPYPLWEIGSASSGFAVLRNYRDAIRSSTNSSIQLEALLSAICLLLFPTGTTLVLENIQSLPWIGIHLFLLFLFLLLFLCYLTDFEHAQVSL